MPSSVTDQLGQLTLADTPADNAQRRSKPDWVEAERIGEGELDQLQRKVMKLDIADRRGELSEYVSSDRLRLTAELAMQLIWSLPRDGVWATMTDRGPKLTTDVVLINKGLSQTLRKDIIAVGRLHARQ